jgi:hypothetical protein
MSKHYIVKSRIDQSDHDKLMRLVKASGMNVSVVVRELVRNAELVPQTSLKPVAKFNPQSVDLS